MKLKIFCWPILLLFFCSSVWALPQQLPVPGGIIILPLKVDGNTAPKVTYEQQQVLVVKQDSQWQAVVGIPLAAKPGIHKVLVDDQGELSSILFEVKHKSYPTQHVNVPDDRKVNPYDV